MREINRTIAPQKEVRPVIKQAVSENEMEAERPFAPAIFKSVNLS